MTWGKRRGAEAKPSASESDIEHVPGAQKANPASRETLRRKVARAALAVLLAATLLPTLPPLSGTETAEALTSTTDYSKILEPVNLFGAPGAITGSTMRLASTGDTSYYINYGNLWGSCSGFVSNDKVSFLHNWDIKFTGKMPSFPSNPDVSRISLKFAPGFTQGRSPTNTTGHIWNYRRLWNENNSSIATTMYFCEMLNGMEQGGYQQETSASWSATQQMSFSYNARTDTAILKVGSSNLSIPNVRSKCGNSAYLVFLGIIEWSHSGGASEARAPFGMSISATFNSMTLPNLDPLISSIVLYRYNEETNAFDIPVNENDVLDHDEVVLARCSIKNQNANAAESGYKEQFAMHLKLADTADHPTQGITPFADATHPLQVNGTTIATAPGDNTLTGDIGVPITLIGNDEVGVTYYARVNQTAGEAVVLSHELIEDTFKGNQFATMKLISEPILKPGTGNDPDLTPGKDYHYTRLPAPNENGWNGIATSPVAVTFFGGDGCDFDQFAIRGSNGTPIAALTPGANAWIQADDVDMLPVEFQATNSVTGAVSSKGTDVIRIDTHEPALSYDAATGTLTAGDAAPAGSGKAASGIWRIERVKADGRPLAAQDVTPRGDAVQALAGGTAAAPSASAGQASWVFPLADGKGQPAQSVPSAQPGFYAATDAAGNVSAVLEVKAATDPDEPGPDDPDPDNPGPGKPDNPGDNPNPSTPTFPTVTPKPGDGPDNPAPDPLKPTHVETDPSTGLSHATVQDAITIPTSPDKVTTAMMAQLIDRRYTVTSSLGDSRITAGPVRLLDAAGNPADAIDRTRPGAWYAEQTFTDAAGNTTTIRLTITVRDSLIDGTIGTIDNGNGNSSANAGTNGDGSGEDHRTALANRISRLPQTGGILGPCPLHILFVLMAVMASAYSLARLRQNRISRDRKRQREEQSATARTGSRDGLADGCTGQLSAGECERSGLSPFDALVYGFITLCALAVGFLALCPWDMLLAVLTVLACVLWAALLHHRRPAGDSREEPAFR